MVFFVLDSRFHQCSGLCYHECGAWWLLMTAPTCHHEILKQYVLQASCTENWYHRQNRVIGLRTTITWRSGDYSIAPGCDIVPVTWWHVVTCHLRQGDKRQWQGVKLKVALLTIIAFSAGLCLLLPMITNNATPTPTHLLADLPADLPNYCSPGAWKLGRRNDQGA